MLDKRYEFLKKLGVGFDSLFEVVDNLNSAYFSEDYPPFNMVRTDSETYVVQVSMVGYDLKDIKASHKHGILTIKADMKKSADEADDVYFHHGIKDGDTYIKFIISQGLRFEGSVFEKGVLYVTYKTRKEGDLPLADGDVEIKDELTAEEQLMKILPHSGRVKFDSAGRARLRKQRMNFRRFQYDNAGRPVAVMDLEDETKVDEAETKALLKDKGMGEKAADKLTKELVKEEKKAAKKEDKPAAEKVSKEATKEVTVEVEAPDNKPQILEAEVKKEGDTVKLDLKDATIEVSDDVVLEQVKTDKGKADVVVAVKKEDKVILDEAKVDIVETVKEVVDALDSAPALPGKTEKAKEKKTVLVDKEKKDKPTVEVTVPKELTSVVEVKKDDKPTKKDVPAIVLEDTSEDIKPEAELLPIVTPEGNPDVVIAIEPEVKKELEDKGVDVVEVVEKAVAKTVEEVKTSEPVVEEKLEEASADPVVAEVEEKAAEEKVELINKEADTPTVEVKNDLPEEPVAVVEIKIDTENTDPVAVEVPPLVVEDATVEVSDNAKLAVVKTEEGTADLVVAVTPEVEKVLEKAKVTPEEVVAEVVTEAPEVVEVVEATEPVEDVVIIVDKADDNKPTVEVTVGEVVPQVVVAKVKEPEVAKEAVAVELKDATEDIPADAVLHPIVTPDGQPDMVLAVEPETAKAIDEPSLVVAVEKAVNQADVVVDVVVDAEEVEEASDVEEVIEKLDEIAKEPATIVVDAHVEEKPTVEVTLAAEESPQVVEVKLDEKPSDPLVPAIVVEDATIEVSDTAELIVAKTDETKADVVIAIEPETKELLEKADVVVEEVVAKALEINDAQPEVADVEEAIVEEKVLEKVAEKLADPVFVEETKDKPAEEVVEELKEEMVEEAKAELVAEPVESVTVLVDKAEEEKPTVEVTVDEVIPQVVAAVMDKEPASADVPSIDLVATDTEISTEATLVPVVTPEGQPDIVVAVEPEVMVELEKVEANVAEVLEKAVNVADVEVLTTESTTVDETKVEEASDVEEVVEKLEEIAKEPATLLVDDMVEGTPTVEVTLAAEDAPQIVEVKLDEEAVTDHPAIVVEDATVEIVSDNVELLKVTTEEGKSDVVIAIEPEVKAELEAKDVVVEEVVAKALEANDAVPEVPEATISAPVTEVKIDSVTNADKELTVEVPEVVSQVVELEKEGDNLTVADTSDSISEEAVLEVVHTPEGSADMVVAATPEVTAELETEGLTPAEVVEKVVEDVKPVVETVVEAELPDPAPVEEKAKKPVVVVKKKPE